MATSPRPQAGVPELHTAGVRGQTPQEVLLQDLVALGTAGDSFAQGASPGKGYGWSWLPGNPHRPRPCRQPHNPRTAP